MIKRALVGLLAVLLVLAAALLINTLRQGSRQVVVPALAPLPVNEAALAEAMSTAVQARTVSGLLDPASAAKEFESLHAYLRTRYPLVHATLERELVGSHSLLYTWRGSDAQAKPLGLLAHQDVVPIAPGTETLWKRPPFSGLVEDGLVWGRGTLDNKSNVVAQLEAVELLLKAGFKPRRTVYLIFGHDEEVGGRQGAVLIAGLFKQRGVQLDFVIDEGLAVTQGILPGVAKPLALIGLAEKGGMSLRLIAEAPPGHSSMPPTAVGSSAIGMLSAALNKLDSHPVPGGIQGAAGEMFEAIAPELPFGQRLAMSNLWLLKPVVEGMLAKGAATNAMMRTTTALTIVNAGNKENVLPGRAEATVNFRILPGDTSQAVIAHVKRVIADERIEIKAMGTPAEPSRISSSSASGFKLIERTIREVFPDSMVAPGLVVAGTDSRHFEGVADQVYRFMPIRFKPDDLPRLHGTDERISVAQLADMVRFHHRLLSQAGQ